MRQAEPADPQIVFLYAIAGYVALLCVTTVGESGLLKALSYVAAFGLFVTVAAHASALPRSADSLTGFGFALAVYYYGLLGSLAYNFREVDWSTATKMLMVPLFVLFGSKCEALAIGGLWRRWDVRALFASMVILPLAVWGWQLATGSVSFGSGQAASIFGNRNNAALYAITVIALLNLLRPYPLQQPLVYLSAGVLFGTLGVLLAVSLAIALVLMRAHQLHRVMIPVAAAVAVMTFLPLEHAVFERFGPARDSLALLTERQLDLRSVSYAQLVQKLQTTDLSLIFRLKHWLDLLTIFASGSIFDWVFGFGIGSSVRLSESGLVPHNDYLRVLFEGGVVTFAGFVALIAMILRRCGINWQSIPLVVVAIYFVSENLINNFAAMAIFFFCAGGVAVRMQARSAGRVVHA